MILVMLMLTSVLASIDFAELQETREIEDTSGRASSDAEVVVITSPRETKCTSSGSCTDELLSGIPVNFKAYLRNSGDADLTDMQYQVNVYIDNSGNRGDLAKDSNGNDLSWQNLNAVCAANALTGTSVCDETAVTPGSFVTGGEATLMDTSGTVIEWTPSSGTYIVTISVTSDDLGDPGNNELGVSVTVRDYYDVAVDMEWIDGAGNSLGDTIEGEDPQNFKVSVSLNAPGMGNMTIRNATLQMTYTNVDAGDAASFTVGVSSNVETYSVQEDQTQTTTGTRLIIGDDGNFGSHVGVVTGTITPPSSASSGSVYQVTAELTGFTTYDYHQTCGSDPFNTIKCEESFDSTNWDDEYTGSNIATIEGSADSFHNAELYEFQLISVDADEGTYNYFGGLGMDITSSLSPGDYILYAELGYESSSNAFIYDWNMSFEITSDSGVEMVYANDCTLLTNNNYDYTYLGMATTKTDAEMLGKACVSVTMVEGMYSITAEGHIIGQYLESTETVDTKVADMSLANNRDVKSVNVENFAPQILTLTSDGKNLVFGGDTAQGMTLTVDAFDVEGGDLTYEWTDSMGVDLGCDTDSNQCYVDLISSMIPTFEFNVKVTDQYGDHDSDSASVTVWNSGQYTSVGLADGITAKYDIVYMTTGLEVEFDNATKAMGQELPGYDGSYDSVASVTFNPSTTFDSDVVNNQDISVHFENDLGATSMWVKVGNLWQLLDSGTPDEVTATTSSYDYNWASGTNMLASGSEIHLFGGQLSQAEAPSANISAFSATAVKAGGISVSWNVTGTMLNNDKVVVNICDSEENCATPDESSYGDDVTSMLYSGQNTVHGNVYYLSASVCRGGMCSNEATMNVTADKEVASVTAEGLTIANSGETWVLDWTASAESDDVASWLVCFLKASFTASEMSDLIDTAACVSTDSTGATIDKYTQPGTYNVHFAVVPVDVVGNTATSDSMSFIEYNRTSDTSNPDDGSETTESEASSGIPTLAWGIIGVIVVAAFVVGAFILSRGEGGDDENKDWDY